MMHSLEKDFKELIKIGGYVEVSTRVVPPHEIAHFAYREKLWMFGQIDSTILWDGKGEDPRSRKRVQQDPQSNKY